MADLAKLKKSRNAYRLNASKLFAKFDNPNYDTLTETQRYDVMDELNGNIITIQSKHDTIKKLDEKILELLSDGEEMADELNANTEFELKVQKYVSKLKRLEQKLEAPYANVNVTPIATGTITATVQQPIIERKNDGVRLPKIEIPKFKGDPGQDIGTVLEEFPHLKQYTLAENDKTVEKSIDVLIGGDYYWELMTGDVKKDKSGLTLLKSLFGYVLSGPMKFPESSTNVVSTHVMKIVCETREDKLLSEEVKNFWDLETIGIKENERSVYDKFNDENYFAEGRFVNLWQSSLPDHYLLSKKRLDSLHNRIGKNPELFEQYSAVFDDQLSKGVIELVLDDDPGEPHMVTYLPHREVVRPDKITTKVRVVFDASAKYRDGVSLNDVLYKGLFENVKEEMPTKREILKIIAGIYDPIGFVQPLTIGLKLLFREICLLNVGWDETLPNEICTKWLKVVQSFMNGPAIVVNRYYFTGCSIDDPIEKIYLHGFSDAADLAYGCCVYIKGVTKCENAIINFVTSKSRVVPLKKQEFTIPRKELLGNFILSTSIENVNSSLSREMFIDGYFCWSDSMITLSWIKAIHKEFKTFVENRVDKIRKIVSPSLWNYYSTDANPADLTTRKENSVHDDLWWQAPSFLLENIEKTLHEKNLPSLGGDSLIEFEREEKKCSH
ncbi:uncharacterized protein [Clytia hemisphaerica]|uniref:uncharacterized protein n=1 Tax=Clytia hemisphaerica TaxID=252671 RepID=UPI0034D798D8